MVETFEHTADLGLRICAANLDELFDEAGRGLFSFVVENTGAIQPRITQIINLKAETLDNLFFDWLSELLYRFDAQQLVLCRFDVQISGLSLVAKVAGEPVDRARHRFLREVKSITPHDLVIRQSGQHWEAEVIVDI